jgi:hypothetical protein
MLHITLQTIKLDEDENYYRTERNKGGRRDRRISDDRQLKGNRTKGGRKFTGRRGDVETITEGKGTKGWRKCDERKSWMLGTTWSGK